ncbi:MAG: FAD-binding oxidoreductase [Candidatus Hodarchaeales archaeon]|jgi:hypothetical protein
MRTYDKIIARIITILLLCIGLACLISLLSLEQYFEDIFMISELFVVFLGVLLVLIDLYLLRNERAAIHSRLDTLQSKGLRVYRKKFERLLYSRDIADLPKLGKLLYDFNVLAVVQPSDHQEIKSVVKLCEEFKIPIIPRGAGTGGYGGGLPTQNGIIVVLTQVKKITSFDPETKHVEIETGITWRRLREYLIKRGFDLFTYPSSAPSSSVGGWIASGGYGIGSSKYGDIAQSIQTVTILGSGDKPFILDDPSDFVGNFGTLGIIWKITLKIREITALSHIAISPKSTEIGLKLFERLQTMNPYYLRYIDYNSLQWITKNEEIKTVFRNAKSGVIVASYLEKDWVNTRGNSEKFDNTLQPDIALDLWQDRFYTLRLKRGGPSIIVSEVIVPSNALEEFLGHLDKWFMKEKYIIEIISLINHKSMAMVWFPTDQRKRSLPILGSLPYLIRWIRSFLVIRIAWNVGGSTYNNGGLWLSPFPNEENLIQVQQIKEIKKKTDPKMIFNPGKITGSRIPRFFPILPWKLFLKIGLPIASILYRALPRRYR